MMALATLAVVAFVQIFALGFQSRNVNHGNYRLAIVTSLFIGSSQAFVWRSVTANSGWAAIAIYSIAGAAGIAASMLVHDRFVTHRKRKD